MRARAPFGYVWVYFEELDVTLIGPSFGAMKKAIKLANPEKAKKTKKPKKKSAKA